MKVCEIIPYSTEPKVVEATIRTIRSLSTTTETHVEVRKGVLYVIGGDPYYIQFACESQGYAESAKVIEWDHTKGAPL